MTRQLGETDAEIAIVVSEIFPLPLAMSQKLLESTAWYCREPYSRANMPSA
jgi:hypothetical protein